VPGTADGFPGTLGSVRFLLEGKGVSFHNFSLPEDRYVCLLLKNSGKRMPEAEIKIELEALHINVQAVMQLRSKHRDQNPEKDRPLTPHYLCGLLVKLETYTAPKGPLQCKHCQRFGYTQRNCGHASRRAACGDAHRQVPQGSSINAAAAGVTTLPTIALAVSGKKGTRLLQNAHTESASKRMASPRACQHPNRRRLDLIPKRRNWAQAETTWSEAAASSRLGLRTNQHQIHPT
jgi:hypothetical protein